MRFLDFRLVILFSVALSTAAQPDFFAQGNKAYDAGDFKSAVNLYRTAIREGQFEVFSWFNMGNALVRLDKPHLAAVSYKRAIELAPRFSRPWILLGDLLYMQGDYGPAIANYSRAIELGESSSHIEHALGECYLRSGEVTLAQKYLEKSVELDPDRLPAWYALSEAYERIEDFPMAVQVLQKAIAVSPVAGADVHFSLGSLYLRMQDTTKGLRSLEDGLALQPGNASVRRYLASLYQESGSPWMAVFTLEDGIAKSNGRQQVEVRLDLAQIYFDQGRMQEAQDQYIQVLRGGDQRGRTGVENVAASYFNAGDTLQASKIEASLRSLR